MPPYAAFTLPNANIQHTRAHVRRKNKKIKIIESTFLECDQEREIDSSPTQTTFFMNIMQIRKKTDWFELGNDIALPSMPFMKGQPHVRLSPVPTKSEG